jgi:general secretion pathway protein F
MAAFDYRAIASGGAEQRGRIDAADEAQAIARLRGGGAAVIAIKPAAPASVRPRKISAKTTVAATTLVGELAVLLRAGLPLDRALALAIGNIEPRSMAEPFVPMLALIREGRPLSEAFARAPELLGPTAVAMTEAGEASGTLPDALARLAEMMERANELRRLAVTSSIYPVALIAIAVGVVLLMLLFVVPQFEGVIGGNFDRLPAASQFVIGASRGLREGGWLLLVILVGAVAGIRLLLSRPAVGARIDALMLRLPLVGPLVQRFETARFARTLGALVDGEVPLPSALALAQRTIGNRHMAEAVARIAIGVREGGGFAGPIAAARILPDIAVGFIRTGEESSELGAMLGRLADVLDRDVRVRLERLVAVLTPLITVVLAAVVTGIIASIMSAILGFNDLALTQ